MRNCCSPLERLGLELRDAVLFFLALLFLFGGLRSPRQEVQRERGGTGATRMEPGPKHDPAPETVTRSIAEPARPRRDPLRGPIIPWDAAPIPPIPPDPIPRKPPFDLPEFMTLDGRSYVSVRVVARDRHHIRFLHQDGAGTLPVASLPPGWDNPWHP